MLKKISRESQHQCLLSLLTIESTLSRIVFIIHFLIRLKARTHVMLHCSLTRLDGPLDVTISCFVHISSQNITYFFQFKFYFGTYHSDAASAMRSSKRSPCSTSTELKLWCIVSFRFRANSMRENFIVCHIHLIDCFIACSHR